MRSFAVCTNQRREFKIATPPRQSRRLMTSSFATRLSASIQAHSPLCVGIDPSASLLKSCGLPDTADGALAFGQRVLEAAEFKISIVKPQSAFFERFGSAGFKAMEELSTLA